MSLAATLDARPRVDEISSCIHCGTRFRATAQRPNFCCAGCEFVHNLIAKNGLDRFYDLRDGATAPVKSLVFQKRDYDWLAELVKTAEADRKPALTLDLQGISCIGCVWLIEKLFRRKTGALFVEVNSALGRITLRWIAGECDIVAFAAELQSFGYLVGPPGKQATQRASTLVRRIGVCGAFAMNAMLFSIPRYLGMDASFEYAALFDRLALFFATLSFLAGGTYFFVRTWSSLRNRVLHIDLPISLGLIAAYGGSVYAWHEGAMNFAYFDFVSTFTFLMLVGRWTQQTAVERNRNRLLANEEMLSVTSLSDEKIAANALQPEMRYRINAGHVVPVRSKLSSDGATLGLEWINGESEACAARRGQIVSAGAINYSQSPIELEAVESWSDSILASLLQITPHTARNHDGTERFMKGYIIAILGIAGIGFTTWFAAGHALMPALQVLISILVVSCPCASGVALPLADELAISALRKSGLFVREQSLWSRINRVRKIIFDKTGTLTLETMALQNPAALDDLAIDEKRVLLRMVVSNLHPVSCCLRETLLASGIEPVRGDFEVEEIVGFGLRLRDESNREWRLGRPGWMANSSAFGPGDCIFSLDGMPVAQFSFRDQIRHDAVNEIALLQSRGYRVHILSGDRAHKVAKMAAQLNLPLAQCHGELSPAEKAEWLRQHDAHDTLMIGDGANDSLAFNEAFCTGTPAIDRGLLEKKADFYFLGRGLNCVRQLLDAGRRRRTTIHRVLTFTISYNVIAVVISLAGKMSPVAAAVLMPLSSLVSLAIVFVSSRRTA